MTEKTLIIHPGTIEYEIAHNEKLTSGEIQRGEAALRLIKETIDNAVSLVITDQEPAHRNGRLKSAVLNGDVYLLIQDDLVVARDCVHRGDTVTIMGAYANVCCDIVKGLVDDVVGNAEIHPIGAWTISNVRERALGLRTKR